jgi:hypothetical protein
MTGKMVKCYTICLYFYDYTIAYIDSKTILVLPTRIYTMGFKKLYYDHILNATLQSYFIRYDKLVIKEKRLHCTSVSKGYKIFQRTRLEPALQNLSIFFVVQGCNFSGRFGSST